MACSPISATLQENLTMWLAKQTKLASRPSNFGDRTNKRNHGCNHIDERQQEHQQQKAPQEQQQKLHPRTTTTTIYVVGCHAAFSDRCCWVPSCSFVPLRFCWLPCRFFFFVRYCRLTGSSSKRAISSVQANPMRRHVERRLRSEPLRRG